jgi:S-(hydroxymethyl)glutathione dehydrogenase / alcohol dehydrogenase
MKAAILVENNSPLVIADIEVPDKLEYGQVLVKVQYSGICGAQINEIEAKKGKDRFLPHLLGHEGGAVVEKVGPGVTFVKKGDHVVMHWMKGNGIQSQVPKYKQGNKIINAGWVTTFNEYAVVSENRLTLISKDIDLKIATLYGCAITTAFGVLHNDARIKSGESVIIFGAGGVGQAICMMAKLSAAYPVIAVDIIDYKLKIAKNIGATHVINIKSGNFRKSLFSILGNDLADITIDTTGIKEIRELAYDTSSSQGRTVLVGVPPHGELMCFDSFKLHFGKIITGSFGGSCRPGYDIPRLIRLQKAGFFDPGQLISSVYPLSRINEAISDVKSGKAVRNVIGMV